jgi:EmrB/QacA subfamily drug resistance transporter
MTVSQSLMPPDPSWVLDRRASRIAGVLVVGAVMVVLDTTVMNVAIGPLSQSMDASLPVIQWVATGYTLAMAAVMPIQAWAVGRLGAPRVYYAAVGLFVTGSLLAGAAWNVEALIGARVVQGLGGGLVMPTVMTIVLRAADPDTRGRIMAILGFPVLIGPVLGPVLGGWVIDSLSWRWVFFINLPLGMLAVLIALRVLPRETPNPTRRLDTVGLLLLSPGLALVTYGLAASGENGNAMSPMVLGPVALGVVLINGFVSRSRNSPIALVDLGVFREPAMAAGAGVVALFAAAYFGSMFLAPLYYQVVRGESATMAGLLLVPQALSTGVTMQIAGRLIDQVPAHRVIASGLILASTGFIGFTTQVSAEAPYWVLVLALSVAGVGVGATLMPTMTTATRGLGHADVASGATLLNVINQVAVSFGFAMSSVLLANQLGHNVPQLAGGHVGEAYNLPAEELKAVAPGLAASIETTFLLPVGLTLAALVVALMFLRRRLRGW